ncbi:hypothetical protein FXF53_23830, partial [Micromonospora sp. WP24]|uniref:hypothetical protein n=1 Tax=Micromonospora sp. WP24 TaxID=2604469 RepID=UPI0011D66DB2
MGRSLRAGVLASTLAVGLLVAPAAPAAAEPGTAAREIAVFPAGDATAPAHEEIILAGVSGFLHRHNNSSEYLWTRYDTGETVPVPGLAGLAPVSLRSAGGDLVFIKAQVPAKPAPGKVSVLDLSDQSWQQWAPPTGYSLNGLYGHTMVVTNTAGTELHTFRTDGTVTRTPVTVPGGNRVGSTVVGDLDSAVVSYTAGGVGRSGLLDFAGARVVQIPDADLATSAGLLWRLTGDTVAWAVNSGGAGDYHLYSRKGLLDGSNQGALALPSGYQGVVRAVVVGAGLVTTRTDTYPGVFFPAVSITADGVNPVTLLPKTDWGSALIQAPDGTALVVGGTGPRDWAVHRITAQPGQSPTTTPLMPVRDPVHNAGLLYHQGVVRHVQAQTAPETDTTQYAV